jgi:hypothetical protein
MKKEVSTDVGTVIGVTAAVVAIALALTVGLVFRIGDDITRPLKWMTDSARKVLGNATERDMAAAISQVGGGLPTHDNGTNDAAL